MPASGKKAAKRAARAAVYNSDDEGDAPTTSRKVGRADPTSVEGGDEDATLSELDADSEDELEEGPLDDLRAVERRMRSSARILGNWKELGASSGK
jgi:ribosomal RNA methyltransferase Nop2